jgi:hypothetical protein
MGLVMGGCVFCGLFIIYLLALVTIAAEHPSDYEGVWHTLNRGRGEERVGWAFSFVAAYLASTCQP